MKWLKKLVLNYQLEQQLDFLVKLKTHRRNLTHEIDLKINEQDILTTTKKINDLINQYKYCL